jgi:DNA-binding PadR family transcriptional regulator
VQAQPTWGYKIKKQVEADFNIKLRHVALYPALNSLEKKGFLESKEHTRADESARYTS